MKTRYKVEDNTPTGMAKRKAKSLLPIAALGLAGYALWQKRDQINDWAQQLKSKAGGTGGSSTTGKSGGSTDGSTGSTGAASTGGTSGTPADYDASRPSVFNSTAMAGPQGGGAGATSGIDGGTMGTDLGTQGEGAL